jgi:hypothetical protein
MSSPVQKQAVEKFLGRRAGGDLLTSSRAMTFGGAGGTLALILLIGQIGVGKPSLLWSLGFAAIALPLWFALALTYEIWLALKLEFSDLWSLGWLHRIQAAVFYISGILTACSIGFLLYSLNPVVAYIFAGCCVVGIVLVGAAMCAAGYRLASHLMRSGSDPHGHDA